MNLREISAKYFMDKGTNDRKPYFIPVNLSFNEDISGNYGNWRWGKPSSTEYWAIHFVV